MAWFSGRVSLGNLDLAGAVNKLSESVKNIEKNFDSALGLEEKPDGSSSSEASGLWSSSTDRKALFDPVMSFMGQKGGEDTESIESTESSKVLPATVEKVVDDSANSEIEKSEAPKENNEAAQKTDEITTSANEDNEVARNADVNLENSAEEARDTYLKPEPVTSAEEARNENAKLEPAISAEEANKDITKQDSAEESKSESEEQKSISAVDEKETEPDLPTEVSETKPEHDEETDSSKSLKKETSTEESFGNLEELETKSTSPASEAEVSTPMLHQSHFNSQENTDEAELQKEENKEEISPVEVQDEPTSHFESRRHSVSDSATSNETGTAEEHSETNLPVVQHDEETSKIVSESSSHATNAITQAVEVNQRAIDNVVDITEQLSSGINSSDVSSMVTELEKVKKEMKMMETALQGAARQAQAKADEIANLMNENEQLKIVIEDLRRKTSEVDIESLREEYHQRVAALERKVYSLTKERDTLRREQNKKSDAAALLKEKDEIITQVMAEGEQLSKKQAAQEAQIRKLRAQIRELEEEKKGLQTKLEVEENKVESIRKDKAATEKLLQESIEKHQAELTTQKEYYTHALSAAKEAEALAEARANNEARTELEGRLREAEERESMLVQALEELRQTLSRKEQQAAFREDMLHKDIEDIQKRYQASERRCEELITQVPESTRPLLRQIEAMQETNARKAEAWAAVEKSLNLRLQEAEAKAAGAEEKERSINERLSQTLSRINVLEAQISCLRAEQTQLTRSLEKERQRAAEHRQEYLALKEEADTNEGRAKQLEDEIRELRRKHKQELQEALTHQELLQQELEREKAARLDQERAARVQPSVGPDQSPIARQRSGFENGNLARKISSASSLSSMEESYFLQASLDFSETSSERRHTGEVTMNPYYVKSMTPNVYEASLRQKEGELASYMSRLASMEAIRDSLAEELVKMTAECEKLRAEAATLPGIRAELEALRRRHSAALELMGERDEELEELRADIVDLKEMYREQVNLLVNKIQVLSSSLGST
ncbi:golgin candidate 5 [Ipomoea triloba]|uniref:golgin candidate 5 n=1 Tax=Ipomoea triloba TaxID=35885 RepID=UPI00125DF0BD|nr:golgin candidate 5 [Ipomoea triloba]